MTVEELQALVIDGIDVREHNGYIVVGAYLGGPGVEEDEHSIFTVATSNVNMLHESLKENGLLK